MTKSKKHDRKIYTPLKEDLFNHIDSLYRSARRSKNYAVALKALELCLKAKNTTGKINNPFLHLQDLSDYELNEMLKTVQHNQDDQNS